MKRVSKLIALALSLVMALSLAACSGGNAAGSAGNDSAEPKTLDVWLPATAADGNDAELWADIIDEWEAENNATVNFQFISWKDYEAKYTSGISTGTALMLAICMWRCSPPSSMPAPLRILLRI